MPVLPETPSEPTWKPSASSIVFAGMSISTQCTKPPGICVTSGSSMTSANDLVPAGASFQLRAGDGLVWPASQVNLDGMLPPSVNAGLEIEKAAANTKPIIRPPAGNGGDGGNGITSLGLLRYLVYSDCNAH